jgi:phenylalanyl-tRNA synthetase alpha chain
LGADVAKLGQSSAFKKGWIRLADGLLYKVAPSIVDDVQMDLVVVSKTGTHPNANILKDLKRRKLIQPTYSSCILSIALTSLLHRKLISYCVKKGVAFTTHVAKLETELTSAMLLTGEWREKTFKPYNFNALGLPVISGHLHPLLKVREEFRKIFFEMGFTEMPTNRYVESSFWNFDALFQPQQHPARDAHDTFFLEKPSHSHHFPTDYLEKVERVHTTGGYESLGYRCPWTRDEASKNILRTHTTAVSARMLYALAQQPVFTPAKYFSIDKVFRNETVDATHLAEFHQIEGLIADYDLSLGNLIGVLDAFYRKLGLTKLRFKPAYNPYTEPSMEIFAYHDGLKKWIEVGNSGIFRPEMLRPMGFPENITVIAWGLSLERPTMIKYGISNIRDLVGHKIDLHLIQDNPICRLDKLSI